MNLPVSWKTRRRVGELYLAVVAVSAFYFCFAVAGVLFTGGNVGFVGPFTLAAVAVRAPAGSPAWRVAVALLVVYVELLRQCYLRRAWVGVVVAALTDGEQTGRGSDESTADRTTGDRR